MTATNTMTIDRRKKRWRQFYDMSQPVSHMLLIRLGENEEGRPLPHPDKKQERIEWAWEKYLKQRERAAWLDDDAIPHLDVYTGTEIFAEAFGCKVHRANDKFPFALPLISKAAEVSRLRVPGLDTPCLEVLFEIADELRARAGSDALVKMVDVQSPMGIAALIWEKRGFYTALLDSPEAVQELADKVKQLLVAFLDAWFSRYGTELLAHCQDCYLPSGMTLSEDEIGSVSKDVCEEFFLPHLAELSDRYGGIGIHCCANARHQWEGIRRTRGLKLLNLVQPPAVLREAYSYFASAAAQVHSWCGDGDPLSWIDQWPGEARVVLQVPADSPSHAVRLCQDLSRVLEEKTARHGSSIQAAS